MKLNKLLDMKLRDVLDEYCAVYNLALVKNKGGNTNEFDLLHKFNGNYLYYRKFLYK